MEKIYTYVFITIGLIALLSFAGYPTIGSRILEQFNADYTNVVNFHLGALVVTILGTALVVLAGLSAIQIGIFGRVNPEIFVTATYVTPLITLFGTLISIITAGGSLSCETLEGTVYTPCFPALILYLLFIPLIVGYVIALYDWVRGRD